MNQLPPAHRHTPNLEENKVANNLRILGVTFIVFGVIIGLMGLDDGIMSLAIGMLGGLLPGMILIGISEIIKLLYNINKKIN